jgi:ketosteroid isomerase-like protein
MDTREIVTRYFEYVNSGRWDDYLTLFADDIVMDEQLMGHVEGMAHLRQSIEALRANSGFRNEPRMIVVDGDQAMAVWHITAPLPNGAVIEADGANYYRVKDGRIAYFSNYHDTRPFAAVMGG